jgi:hypothetical protein
MTAAKLSACLQKLRTGCTVDRTIHTTDSTYAVHNYNVLYRYHPYDDVYKCHSCGHREAVHDFTKEELQREYLSSGTTTVHTES